MALKFNKSKTKSSAGEEEKKSPAHKPKFLKGKAAQEAIDEEDKKAQARAEARNKAFRFFIPFKKGVDNETQITFLDGELDDDGLLDILYAREHRVKLDGRWENIMCTDDEEGYCPICEKGDNPAALVGYLSILDHSEYVNKKGETITVSKKLFPAKRGTLQLLTKKAAKQGGLTGCTFEVMRTGDREAAVGNQFDFIQKDDLKELASENDWKSDLIEALNYEEELTYYTSAELAEMGLGPAMSGPGTESSIDEKEMADKM